MVTDSPRRIIVSRGSTVKIIFRTGLFLEQKWTIKVLSDGRARTLPFFPFDVVGVTTTTSLSHLRSSSAVSYSSLNSALLSGLTSLKVLKAATIPVRFAGLKYMKAVNPF